MDARGFDSAAERSVARPQLVREADRLLVLGATALPLLVMALGAWLGRCTCSDADKASGAGPASVSAGP